MKLGIGTYTYPWAIGVSGWMPENPMDAIGLIKKAQQYQIKLVQIADNLPLHTLHSIERDKIYQYAREAGIDLEVGTRGIKPDHLNQYLEIAEQLHSSILRTVIDTADHQPDPPEIIEILSGLIPKFKKANITLAIENHDRFKCRTIIDMLKALNTPYIGICLDTVNSYAAQESTEHVVDLLGPYTVNLHVKDYTIERIPGNMGLSVHGTPAGEGMLNIPWLLNEVSHKTDRKFNAILEFWMPVEKTIQETIQKEIEWADKSIPYLRNLIPE